MRRALTALPSTSNAISGPITVPAPVGGWNARDSLAAMPITDAERLINWFPEATSVNSRPGSETTFTGLVSQAETLMAYAGTTTLELFVAAGANIYDATVAEGASASASAGLLMMSARSSARWQYENFATPGGNFMICVNGAERPVYYNGTNFSAMTTLTASGGLADNLIDVHSYAERLFYLEKDTLNFWYMESVETILGTARKFPLGSVFNKGGVCIAHGSWTRDGGSGMDDAYFVASDQGEIIVYTGTDPGDANSWSKLGLFNIPKPLGRRCVQKFGGDALILTEGGVLSLSQVLSGIEPQSLLTDKIRTAVSDAVRLYRANYAWQLLYYPLGHWLIINVPIKEGSRQEQYVMNTNTGAWCRFKGLTANCWEVFGNSLYFGASGKVIQADTGTNDDGENVDVDAKQAPSNFGYAGFKSFLSIYPFINSDNGVPVAIGLNIDFNDRSPVSTPSPVVTTLPYWGDATWSSPSYFWAGKAVPQGSLQSGGGSGVYAAMRLKGAVNVDRLQWMATQITFERGGP